MSMRTEAGAQLKSLLERVERLEEEKKSIAEDIKQVYAEAKSNGFDAKAIRSMVKRRRKKPGQAAEEDAIFETYMHAVGMLPENPLASAVAAMAVDTMARYEVVDALKKMVPIGGEIIARIGGAPLRLWRGEDDIARVEEYVELAPAERVGKSLKKSAAVLELVPKDPVKAAADAAEARSKAKSREPSTESEDEEEPVE